MSFPLIFKDPALPVGSAVLVTGVNGLIASHIADQLLAAGYHVRGTVRDLQKAVWMLSFFSTRHPDVKFELVQVTDFSVLGCFDEAVKGVAGIMHTTTKIEMTATDPEPFIPDNTTSALMPLEAAAKEASVKRVVFTSTGWAAAWPSADERITVTSETWNEQAVRDAWARGTPACNPINIYVGAKVHAEQALFRFVEETKPGFVFNSILPDVVLGLVLEPYKQGIPSTSGMIKLLFDGGKGISVLQHVVAPQYFTDVVDNARLHVAALLHPDCKGERLFGYAGKFNWNSVISVLRRNYPDRQFVEDMELGMDQADVQAQRSLDLLEAIYGQKDWTSLEDSVKANVDSFLDKDVKIEGWISAMAEASG